MTTNKVVQQNSDTNSPVTFDEHATYTDFPRRQILLKLRADILSWDERLWNGEHCTEQQRITYKFPGDKIFLEVKVRRSSIVLHLIDSGMPDREGILEQIPETHGWGDLKYRMRIVSSSDYKKAKPFIKGAYERRLAKFPPR